MGLIGSILISMRADTAELVSDLAKGGQAALGFSAQAGVAGKALRAVGTAADVAGVYFTATSGHAEEGTHAFDGLADSVKKVTLVLGGIAAAGGAALALRSFVDRALETEKAMTALAKATDLGGTALAGLKNQIALLSLELRGVSFDDLLSIATSGAKLGVAREDLVQYTRGVAMLSTAMDDVPADKLAESIGKINSVFRLGNQGALQIGSAIDKLADSGNSSAGGILDVTQRISGAAVAAHIGADETVALATALLDTGTNAEAGATAVQNLIQTLNTVKGQAGFAKALGISAEEFAAKVKASPIRALQEWLAALKAMGAGEQMAAIEAIGMDGIKGAGEIQKLAQQTESLARNLGLASHEFATLDQINKSYRATAATTGAALVAAGNGFKILAGDVGSAFAPTLKLVADTFTSIVPIVHAVLAPLAGVVGVVMEGIVGIALRKVMLVTAAIRAGMTLLEPIFTGVMDVLQSIFSSGWEIISELVKGPLKVISAAVEVATEFLKSCGGDVTSFFQGVVGVIKGLKEAVLGFLKPLIAGLDFISNKAAETLKFAAAAIRAGNALPSGAKPGDKSKTDGKDEKPKIEDGRIAAADKAQKLADDAKKLTEQLKEQAATFGMTSAQASVYKLQMQGATAAQLAEARASANVIDQLEAQKKQQEELARAQAQVEKEIGSTVARLQEQVEAYGISKSQAEVYRLAQLGASDAVLQYAQALANQRDALEANAKAMDTIAKLQEAVDTYGKSSSELEVYRLEQLGASQAVLAHARALAEQRDQMERAAKAQEDMKNKAKDVFEATRTPLEKYEAKVKELKGLLKAGLIDKETYERAEDQAAVEAGKPGKKKDRKGDDFGKSGFAGALELGSQEARSTVLSFQGAGGDGDGIKGLRKVGDQQLAEAKEQTRIMREGFRNNGGGLKKFIA